MFEEWEATRGKDKSRENDVRSQYDREYGRIIHSAAFRRLQNKTQILGMGESDFYRTRLTHTLEVMQIGEGILRKLEKEHKNNENYLPLLDYSLIRSICLAHDIGHAPFGHSGEVALNVCMRNYGGFEGNGQTLRILTKLEKYLDGFGLNPSKRLALGVLKYPISYAKAVNEKAYGKMDENGYTKASEQRPPKCYLDTEQDVIKWMLESLSESDRIKFTSFERVEGEHNYSKYKSFDASIMELADDISYGIHDLEDGIVLNLLRREHWTLLEDILHEYEGLPKDLGKVLFSGDTSLRKEGVGSLIHYFIMNSFIQEHDFDSPILRYNITLKEKDRKLLDLLKEIVTDNVINNINVQLLEYKGERIVTKLFQIISSDPERFLYGESLHRIKDANYNEEEVARAICDYIAGMTDPHATRLYLKVTQPGAGSIFEYL